MNKKFEKFIEKLWRIFSSMKMGLVLLGIIALASGIGTIIPQQSVDPEGAAAAAQIWKTLQFTDVYSSPWFLFLFGLLCVNLIVCSVQRFQGIYKRTFSPQPPHTISHIPQKIHAVVTGADRQDLREKTLEIFKKKGFRIIQLEKDGGWSFIAQKRSMGNWGSFITHIAFVMLSLGVLIGSLSGFKGYMVANEGSVVSIQDISLSAGQIKQNFMVRINSVEDRMLENGERDNWYTDLSILESGEEVLRGTLSVNHPLTYKGVTFYQSGYAPGAMFTIDRNGEKSTAALQGGNYINAPGTDLYFVLAGIGKYHEGFAISYQIYETIYQVKMGQLTPGQSENVQGAFTITFDGMVGFTGLQVKEDPGVGAVFAGCGFLMIGLLLSFYWRPVCIAGILDHAAPVLALGAYPGKLEAGVRAEFNQIIEEIKA